MTATTLRTALVIGCGTAGTSVALALTGAGVDVALLDEDPQALAEAVALGAGTGWTPRRPPAGIVVIATPPSAVAAAVHDAQSRGLGYVYTDLAGTKEIVCAEAELRGCDLKGYVPGHPLIGPGATGRAADAGRFAGRPWVLCPYDTTPGWALETAAALIELCGAHRLDLAPHVHDEVVAVGSHLPYLVAAVLSAGLAESRPEAVALAGGEVAADLGAAGADPVLGGELLAQNAGPLADALDRTVRELSAAARMLHTGEDTLPVQLTLLLERGRRSLAAIEAAAANTAH